MHLINIAIVASLCLQNSIAMEISQTMSKREIEDLPEISQIMSKYEKEDLPEIPKIQASFKTFHINIDR